MTILLQVINSPNLSRIKSYSDVEKAFKTVDGANIYYWKMTAAIRVGQEPFVEDDDSFTMLWIRE